MNPQDHFELFGPAHLVTMAALCLAGAMIILGARRWALNHQAEQLAMIIGVFMIVQEVFDRSCHHFLNGEPVKEVLPFHLCGMSVLLAAIMLITRSRRIYELVYFWGLAGASMAIITPDIEYTFPDIIYITYFTSHALIVVGVLLMTVLFRYRPTLRSLGKALVLTNVYMFMVIPLNLVLDTNYLYVRHKPAGGTLIDFLGPWPWYILALEAIGTLFFSAVYAPWLVRDLIARKPTGPAQA